MGMTERLPIVMTNTEPSNKHVIWLKDDMLKRWTGVGWKNIGGTGGSGTTNYNELINKPKINGVVLQGDVELELGTNVEIIDNLDSTDIDKALSANQGRALKELINSINIEGGTSNIDVSNLLNIGNGLSGGYDTSNNRWNIEHGLNGTANSIDLKKLNFGDTIEISSVVSVDSFGHATQMVTHSFILPDAPQQEIVSIPLATQERDGLMSKEDKIKLDGLGDASGIILTQAQYDALETYDNVVYFIKG